VTRHPEDEGTEELVGIRVDNKLMSVQYHPQSFLTQKSMKIMFDITEVLFV
jgi:anthranilate/para-aminobenzoate synthase component II